MLQLVSSKVVRWKIIINSSVYRCVTSFLGYVRKCTNRVTHIYDEMENVSCRSHLFSLGCYQYASKFS